MLVVFLCCIRLFFSNVLRCAFFYIVAAHRRDATNPTFRKINVAEVLATHGPRKRSLKMETGPFFVDLSKQMH